MEFLGLENYKLVKMEEKELVLNVDVKVNNPSAFNIKIKPSFVDLYVEDKLLGTIYLDDKIKLEKRDEKSYRSEVRVKLEKGAMINLLKYKLKSNVNVRFEGVVKASVLGLNKKIQVKETKMVSGNKFKFDFF